MKKLIILFLSLSLGVILHAQFPQMPEFPGGKDSLDAYLAKNIDWSVGKKCKEGKVVVSFYVEADGSITNVKIFDSFCNPIDKEVIRVISAMPKWIPGKMGGSPSSFSYALPIQVPNKENR